MKTIGFAGTAKNTGKTTTVLSVLDEMHNRQMKIAVTSIGYDGEQLDNFTGLPKPTYLLNAGDIVATASDCLEAGTARFQILQATNCQTILGKIVIARVLREGSVLVAGPNRQKDVAEIIRRLKKMPIDLLLVDGAVNRLTPMLLCDGLVLSTGAALTPDIEQVTRHIKVLVSFFQLPQDKPAPKSVKYCTLQYRNGTIQSLPNVLTVDPLHIELDTDPGNLLTKAVFPNIINPGWIIQLIEKERRIQKNEAALTIVTGSPLKMIVSGSIEQWGMLMEMPSVQLRVLHTLPLLCLTVNSFYPHWLGRGRSYERAFVDQQDLLSSIRISITEVPVLDLAQDRKPNWSSLLGVSEEEKCAQILI